MELIRFTQSFDASRATLAKIDALVKEAGEHFNEAQVDRAKDLVSEFVDASEKAVDDADNALKGIEAEEVTQEAEDKAAAANVSELKEGQVFIVRDGKPFLLEVVPFTEGGLNSRETFIVGQRDQRLGHDDAITRTAAASIERGFQKTTTSHGITTQTNLGPVGTKGPAGPISTVETGEKAKEGAGDAINLASSEGDLSTHHTGDGSREILPVEGTEGLKSLVTDTGAVTQVDAAHQRTGSLDADRVGDEAAIETGAQETAKPVVVVDQPGDAGNLIEHPLKSSGIDGDAGDWTTWGRDAEGFPVVKGSPSDVS